MQPSKRYWPNSKTESQSSQECARVDSHARPRFSTATLWILRRRLKQHFPKTSLRTKTFLFLPKKNAYVLSRAERTLRPGSHSKIPSRHAPSSSPSANNLSPHAAALFPPAKSPSAVRYEGGDQAQEPVGQWNRYCWESLGAQAQFPWSEF